MIHNFVIFSALCSVAVSGLKIVSKTEPVEDVESIVEIDSPLSDHSAFDAVFAGIKKPVSVDCTQPGVICKFPLVVAKDDSDSSTPAKLRAVPVIKGVAVSSKEEKDLNKKEELVSVKSDQDNAKVPIFKGSLDIGAATDEKDIEDTWILEKNILNKKYQIPVKLIPSKHNREGIAPVYPVHHDFHDHYNGHPYNFPSRHSPGWSPWIRSYPSVYNYPSNQPCHPPVYHHPPPCSSSVAPTKKPINIDDKVDKDEY